MVTMSIMVLKRQIMSFPKSWQQSLIHSDGSLKLQFSVDFHSGKNTLHGFPPAGVPTATILPRMHIMEDHVNLWLRRWYVGAGLMGEPEAESLPSAIHKMVDRYSGILE